VLHGLQRRHPRPVLRDLLLQSLALLLGLRFA
jgi:hypothetical protein